MSSRQKGTGKRSNQTSNGHEDKRFKNGHTNGNESHESSVKFRFSQILKSQEESVSTVWNSGKNPSNNLTDFDFISEPFQCGIMHNMVEDSADIFSELIKELQDVEMSDKNNDLYKFKQSSKDLKYSNSSHISALKDFLQTDVRTWLQNVTGIKLNEEIDLFCAKYR